MRPTVESAIKSARALMVASMTLMSGDREFDPQKGNHFYHGGKHQQGNTLSQKGRRKRARWVK